MDEGEKLLARMRATKSGWGPDDLETLYLSFGFHYREGGSHRIYFHPRHPELYATVARHRKLAKGYVDYAVKLIDRLKRMEEENARR